MLPQTPNELHETLLLLASEGKFQHLGLPMDVLISAIEDFIGTVTVCPEKYSASGRAMGMIFIRTIEENQHV